MARITIEDCLKGGYNKFGLVHLAAKRVFQLKKGKEPLISASNREVVTALREIAAGRLRKKEASDLLGDDSEKQPEIPDEGADVPVDQDTDSSDVT